MSNPPTGFPMPGPPPGQGPGGSYYGTPPGRGGNSGCAKAFGITCLTLLILGIIITVGLFSTFRGTFQTIKNVAAAEQDGQQIRRAVVAYHDKNGKYPKTLMSLVTDGESDGRDFHSPADPDPNPAHVSWVYTPPAKGAPGNTPILDLPYQVTVMGHSAPSHITINLDGSTSSSSAGAGSAPPPGPPVGGSNSP